jgi:YD repeat-containing protein
VEKRAVSGWLRGLAVGVAAAVALSSGAVDAAAAPAAAVPVVAPEVAAPVVEPLTPGVPEPLGTSRVAADAAETPPVWGDFQDDPMTVIPEVAPSAAELPEYVKDVEGFEPGRSQVVDRYAAADVYVNPDGSYTVRASAGQINVADDKGEFVPIVTDLVTATREDAPPVAREQVSGAPALQPMLTAQTHPLRPVFGSTAESGTVAVAVDQTSVMLTPVVALETNDDPVGGLVDTPPATTPGSNSASAIPETSAAPTSSSTVDARAGPVSPGRRVGDEVVYAGASAGSDLVYEVMQDAVKETIVLDRAPGASGAAEWAFWLDVKGGTPKLVESGAIEVSDAAGELVIALPIPYIQDSAGVAGKREPNDVNGSYGLEQVEGRWQVTVRVDREWLNRKDITYPVLVDPTLYTASYGSAVAYKNNGVIVQDGLVREGSPNDGAGGMWRGVANFNFGYLLNQNYQLVDAETQLGVYDGTTNSYSSTMHHATSFNYNGVGTQLGSGAFGTGATYTGGALTTFLRAAFVANDPTAWFMFRGQESSTTAYTYKRFQGEMYLTVNRPAPAATLIGPMNQSTQVSVTPVMSASAVDPEGDPVEYYFRIGRTVNPDNDVIWESGWGNFTGQVQVPSNVLLGGTTYYWRVITRDYCSSAGDPCGYGTPAGTSSTGVWAFTTNTPPNPLTAAGSAPASGTVATLTPTLSVAATTDPDNAPNPLKYWFAVATGPDGRSGTVISSGWVNGTSWQVPTGYLKDGVSYSWTAWAYDGISRDQGLWSNRLTVDLRTGDPRTSPTDAVGPVTVNLANGNVIYSTGSPATSFAKTSVGFTYTYNSQAAAQSTTGLIASYYQDLNKNGVREAADVQVLQRTEPTVNAVWETGDSPYPGVIDTDFFFARWTGLLTAPSSGQFLFGAAHDDALTITVNGVNAYSNPCCFLPTYQTNKPVTLTAGQPVPFTAEYTEGGGRAFTTVYVKRVDGAPLYSGGPVEMQLPASWLSTGATPALPAGWNLSTDVDGDPGYVRAMVSEESITLVDASGSPHIYTRTLKDGVTGWAPPAGEQGTLSVVHSGAANAGEITVIDPDGSRSLFAPDGTLRDYQPADVTGTATALQYSWTGTPGRLRTVTDPISTLSVRLDYQRSGDNCYGGVSIPSGMVLTPPSDLLCRVTYPDGEFSLLWYDSNGRLARLVDPGGETTDLGYDSNGRLSKVRDPLAFDAITAGSAPNNDTVVSLISYLANGKASSVQGPAPTTGANRPLHTITYVSTPTPTVDGVTQVVDAGAAIPNGFTSKVTYNHLLQSTTVTDALNRVTQTVYNAKDQLQKTIDPAGRVSTTVYDYADRPTASYGPAPASCFTGLVPTTGCTATVPTSSTAYDQGLTGLHVDWYNNVSLAGAPTTRTLGLGASATAPLTANWVAGSPVPGINADNFSFRSTGYLTFPAAGNYQFRLVVDNYARIWINNVQVVDHWFDDAWNIPRTFYLQNVPAGTVWPIKIEAGELTGDARIDLTWQPPGAPALTTIPAANLNPGYGLATTVTTTDSSPAAPSMTVTNNYGDKPWEGLPVSSTQADGGPGLTSTLSYDTLRRRTARALPNGSITDPNKRWTDTYYGNTETRANPCVGGSAAVNQAGRLKTTAGPLNSASLRVTEEVVYDLIGRVVASRVNTDPWVCNSYDTRSRPTTTTYPATVDDPGTPINEALPARTVTNTYAVGGNPLITSTNDTTGTISTTTDLLGRTVSYTDIHGTVTTSAYTQDGRITSEASTPSGGGGTSTLGYTYNAADDISTVTLDGTTLATTTINTAGELTGETYNANSTSGAITRDTFGRVTALGWTLASSRVLTNTVTRSQTGRVLTDATTDTGATSSNTSWAYTYDPTGRLTNAALTATTTRTSQYSFTAATSGSCPGGSAATAGRNSNRASLSVSVGGGAAQTTQYCYDQADRLLASLGTGATTYTYNTRGNTTASTPNGGTATRMVFDAADRHIRTDAPNGSGGTASIVYQRDATDRITIRTVTGSTTTSENGAFPLSYSNTGDTPDIELTTAKALITRTVVLPGGVTYIKNYPTTAASSWLYPNIHGDNIATT